MAARHRFTALGWAWPLVRQLAQFAVLLVVFSAIVDLEIPSYPAFLFAGLVGWAWFATGVADGTGALLARGHLLMQPRCPAAVIPLVPLGTALVDALIALPVLVALVLAEGALHPEALLLPAIAAIQLVLMAGIVWMTAAASVYLRDVRHVVTIALTLLFYLTPVFYELGKVPESFRWLLHLNPMTTLIESYRDVLIGGRLPGFGLLGVCLASVLVAVAGLAVFNRLRPGFVDEL
jgi:lipopolysaccharide transport system permease protein